MTTNSLTARAPAGAEHPVFTPDCPAARAATRRRRIAWRRIFGGAAVLAVAAAAAGGYAHYAVGFVTTDDSFLEGNVHPVSARINGTVARVLVDDNAHVEAGQPLFEIDPADLDLAVQAGEADLAQARANATQVTAQIARAAAEVDAAAARVAQNAAQLNRAELDFHRMEMLAGNEGAISRQAFDGARAAFEAAQATQASLVAERASADAGLAAARAQRAVAQAQIEKAEAALGIAKLQAGYAIVRAPSSGRIAKKTVEVGQRLQSGQPVMAVVGDRVWVIANFKESQLARLRVGEPVEVKVDAVDGRVFHGVLDSFSPGTGAKFSLLPPDNSTGNFTKIVQRVPVKIVFTGESLAATAGRLAPGLSATVKVRVRD